MSSHDVDTALMLRVAAGDAQAMNTLFERTYADVRSLCLRLSGRAELADDLAQETFLRALRYASTFRGESRFSTWVYRIARNVCLDHGRGPAAVGLDEIAEPAAETSSRDDLLEHAISRLPGDQREALVLVRLHGMRYEEAAPVLGCSPGAARTRVCRGLQNLRRIIQSLDTEYVL